MRRARSIRRRVHSALLDEPAVAAVIAERAGVTHRQAVDALMYLYNHEHVTRLGRRRMARWRKQTADEQAIGERHRRNAAAFE